MVFLARTFVGLYAAALLLFTRSYLETYKSNVILNKILLGMVVLTLGVSAANLAMPVELTGILFLVAFADIIVLVLVIIRQMYKGYRQAKFYLAAFLSTLVGGALSLMPQLKLLPQVFITDYGITLGGAATLVLFSLGLSDKVNTMRKTQIEMNRKLEENEKVAKQRAEYLEGVVKVIDDISRGLVSVSKELETMGAVFSDISNEQASGAQQLSSTFEELAASVEVINTSMENQKSEVEKTNNLVQDLKEVQEKVFTGGNEVVLSISSITEYTNDNKKNLDDMIGKMTMINEGGRSIGNFLSIIDDINDKINLLSLNAAIEAARAGDYGKGFAVVSDEIGKLASATASNSQEIGREIDRIQKDITAGMDVVNTTRMSTDRVFEYMDQINSKIETMRELMNGQLQVLNQVIRQAGLIDELAREVAVAINEQSTSMNETMDTVARLSEMATQLNASHGRIMEFTRDIGGKAEQLESLVREV
jgi:ABC-type transporter Mla subunit MlaD